MNNRQTKFEQPKNFIRKKTKGMTKKQAAKFYRKIEVNSNKTQS